MQEALSKTLALAPQQARPEDSWGRHIAESLEAIEKRWATAEDRCHRISAFNSQVLAVGLPLLLGLLLVVAPFAPGFLQKNFPWSRLGPAAAVFIVWSFLLTAALALFYFAFALRMRVARNELARLDELFQTTRLSDSENRLQYLRERLVRLTNQSARVFIEDGKRYEQATKWRQAAGRTLNGDDAELIKEGFSLSEAQFSLDSLNELIVREQREQKEQRNGQLLAMLIMAIYIVGLTLSVIFSERLAGSIPLFGIPLSVVMWGGAGSLAAILYRFYTERERVAFASEVRWLVARPIIGIVMSAVVYIALVSGLILLGASEATADKAASSAVPTGRLEVYWVIAFLAGFSDKFYIGVINLLVKKSLPDSDEGALSQVLEEREAKEPDAPSPAQTFQIGSEVPTVAASSPAPLR